MVSNNSPVYTSSESQGDKKVCVNVYSYSTPSFTPTAVINSSFNYQIHWLAKK